MNLSLNLLLTLDLWADNIMVLCMANIKIKITMVINYKIKIKPMELKDKKILVPDWKLLWLKKTYKPVNKCLKLINYYNKVNKIRPTILSNYYLTHKLFSLSLIPVKHLFQLLHIHKPQVHILKIHFLKTQMVHLKITPELKQLKETFAMTSTTLLVPTTTKNTKVSLANKACSRCEQLLRTEEAVPKCTQ